MLLDGVFLDRSTHKNRYLVRVRLSVIPNLVRFNAKLLVIKPGL